MLRKYTVLFFLLACVGGLPFTCCGPSEPMPPPESAPVDAGEVPGQDS